MQFKNKAKNRKNLGLKIKKIVNFCFKMDIFGFDLDSYLFRRCKKYGICNDKSCAKEEKSMKEKKKDTRITKDPVGDPAFYNDQIGENKQPERGNLKKKENKKRS